MAEFTNIVECSLQDDNSIYPRTCNVQSEEYDRETPGSEDIEMERPGSPKFAGSGKRLRNQENEILRKRKHTFRGLGKRDSWILNLNEVEKRRYKIHGVGKRKYCIRGVGKRKQLQLSGSSWTQGRAKRKENASFLGLL